MEKCSRHILLSSDNFDGEHLVRPALNLFFSHARDNPNLRVLLCAAVDDEEASVLRNAYVDVVRWVIIYENSLLLEGLQT